MTCIVGIRDCGRVLIGADSAGSAEGTYAIRTDPKVFELGEFVIGFTTSYRMGQVLRFQLRPPSITWDLYAYMATEFIDATRLVLKASGFGTESQGGDFLVGVRGRLFRVGSDYQVGEYQREYVSIGNGFQVAEGSLFSTRAKQPEERLEEALAAAAAHCHGVHPPFVIMEARQ